MNKKDYTSQIDFSKVIESGDNLAFYIEITNNIIDYIRNNKSATFQEITKYVGGSDRRVIRLLDQLVELKILRFYRKRFFLRDTSSSTNFKISDVCCNFCDSKIVNIDGKLKPVRGFVESVLMKRPTPTFIFDQRPVNADTIVRRVAYLILKGDAQDKKIALIGDDDLTCVALAKTGVAREVVVFDIDERVLESIESISQKYKLGIKVVKQDLLKNTPKKFQGYFDVFITDPTPTLKPLVLFTNRGLEMLKKGRGKVGYISLYPSHMEKTIDFQKVLGEMNILITDLIPAFNQYDFLEFTYTPSDLKLLKKYAANEAKISFSEHLMRIETTDASKPIKMEISPLDLVGRATIRILDDPSKDPVLIDKQKHKSIQKTVSTLQKLIKQNERN